MKEHEAIAINFKVGNAGKMELACRELSFLFDRAADILSTMKVYKPESSVSDTNVAPDPIPAHSAPSDKPAFPEKPRRPGKPPVLTEEQEARFDRFWAIYPRKESKPDAREAWKKINPDDALTDKIIEAVKAAKLCDSRFRELRFTPHPASWINNAGWENEYNTQKL